MTYIVAQAGQLTFRAVEGEPIGKRELELFFQNSNKYWAALMAFLNQARSYRNLVDGDIQRAAARDMLFVFANPGAARCAAAPCDARQTRPSTCPSSATCTMPPTTSHRFDFAPRSLTLARLTVHMFSDGRHKAEIELSGEPFRLFRTSTYYKRFLQWKVWSAAPSIPRPCRADA